jgi:hypothetical protein
MAGPLDTLSQHAEAEAERNRLYLDLLAAVEQQRRELDALARRIVASMRDAA